MLKVTCVATPLEHRGQSQSLRAENVGQHTAAWGCDGWGRCWHCCHRIPECFCCVCRWSAGQPAEAGPSSGSSTGKLLMNLFNELKVLWHLTRRDLVKTILWPHFAQDPKVRLPWPQTSPEAAHGYLTGWGLCHSLEYFGLENLFKDHLFQILAMGIDIFH